MSVYPQTKEKLKREKSMIINTSHKWKIKSWLFISSRITAELIAKVICAFAGGRDEKLGSGVERLTNNDHANLSLSEQWIAADKHSYE